MAVNKSDILAQYKDIASQYNQPVTYADSPVFQAGFETWNPTGIGSVLAKGAQKAKSALGLNTAATAAPFGSGMYVPSKEEVIQNYIDLGQSPENAKALGDADWATQFGHETSHLGWEYESLGKQLASISPHLMTSASNPSYAGEEQWNYMHDLMYGPQYGEEWLGRPGQDYLTTKGLINPGDLSYTPYAHDVIGKSGLTTAHKQAIGFGINPFEDTRAAGQFYQQQKYKNMSKVKKQAQMQDTIRRAEAIEAAKKTRPTNIPGTPIVPTGGGGISNINIQKRKIGMPEHLTYTPPAKTVTPRHAPSPYRGGKEQSGGSAQGGGGGPPGGEAGWKGARGGYVDRALGGRSRYL